MHFDIYFEGLAALPVFLGLRAAIRAKVIAAQVRQSPEPPGLRDQALSYFGAATGFMAPLPPRLVAVGGLSGTGKTTLAAAIAPPLGRAPGALHLRSDLERKRRFDIPETTRLPAGAYAPDVTAAVYATLGDLAEQALRAGQAVIADATYQRPGERDAITTLAARAGVPFLGLWLEAPLEMLVRRVEDRRQDASDAKAATVASQPSQAVGAVAWRRLDASGSSEALRIAALDRLRDQTSTA